MSFDQIINESYKPKREEVVLNAGDVSVTLYATEISYLSFLEISARSQQGTGWFRDLVVASIVDASGKHMTLAQAEALSSDHASALLDAALRVNNKEQVEKK